MISIVASVGYAIYGSMDFDSKSNLLSSAQNDSCQSEAPSNEVSEEAKAVMAMKEKLPKDVMDSFIAAGFDTLDVISEIDTSGEYGLQEIEQFITDEHKEDDRFKSGISVSGRFIFLPGHRQRIVNFITALKQEAAKNKLKWPKQTTNTPVIKTKIKLESNLESTTSDDQTTCIDPELQATVAAKIRQQVSKWQRSQKLIKLRELKEIKDFNVNVEVKGERNLSLSITCNICDSRCLISHKGDHILISNWTRHVSKCFDKTRNTISNSKINKFFRPISRKDPDSKLSNSESPSPLPQSSPDEVQKFLFESTQNEQSLVTFSTADDDASSSVDPRLNIDQVSTADTSCSDQSITEPQPHTDWSRSTRKKLALLKSGGDHN